MRNFYIKFALLFLISTALAGQEIIDRDSLVLLYSDKGYAFYDESIFDSAEYYLSKALEYHQMEVGMMDYQSAMTNNSLGIIYRKLGDFDNAMKHLNLAEKYFLEKDSSSLYLGYVYNNKGNVFYDYSDYREAELYYRFCIDYLESLNEEQDYAYGHAYNNLFNILVTQDRIDEAFAFLDKLESRYEEPEVAFRRSLFKAESYYKLGEYKQALAEAKRANDIYYEQLVPDIPLILEHNYLVAEIKVNQGDLDEALDYLGTNIKLINSDLISFYDEMLQTYLLIGNIHFNKGDFDECMTWLDHTIEKLRLDRFNNDPSESLLNVRSYNRQLIDLFRLYARAAENMAYASNDTDYLIVALENYSKSIEYLKISRLHMRNEGSIHFESQARISIIHEAVNAAAKLYNLTNEKLYLDSAFAFSENMKSFALFTNLKKGEAIQFSDLPLDVKRREERLVAKMSSYSELVHNLSYSKSENEESLNEYKTKYFELRNSHNLLQDSIELLYPDYFNLKYNLNFITPEEIQSHLHRNEALVEYVLSDTVLTTFVIDKTQVQVLLQDISPDFAQLCKDYFLLLKDQDFNSKVHDTYKNYVTLGHMFYQTLVEPVLEVTDSREITFVPDGEIMYLPFESFITEKVDKEYINYADLPYLIYDVSVGYSYSSTLLYSDRLRTKSPENKVLAFAPAYDNLMDEDLPREWIRQSDRTILMPLPGAEEEVHNISKAVPTELFLEYEATENNFKQNASDYSVLHLAMHTIMNDEEPLYSKLAFARTMNDTIEDHDLFAYEIYNMKLNADMVVLSSCNTGVGRMQKGEGMMSMARGFMYAGCPSIVMTLWQVSDKSSAELMSSFYKYLKKGKSKKNALRKAKIDYIQSSDKIKSNPYFWSAFMVVGDNTPLYRKSPIIYLSIIIVGFAVIVLLITYRKRIFVKQARKG